MKPPSPLSRLFYYNFRRYYRYRLWYFQRFTTPGRFIQGALVMCAVVGVNTQQALAYQSFGVLLALLLVAVTHTRWFARPRPSALTVLRLLPRYATLGQEVRYRLLLENTSNATLQGLSFIESHSDPRPDFLQFAHAKEPGSERMNRFDRTVGFYRWAWLVRRNQVARIQEILLPLLPPGKPVEVSQTFVPRFRGELRLSGMTLAQRDPLGLCRATREIQLPGSTLVLPRTYPIPTLDLPGQLHHQPEHRVSAATHRDGEEIAGLRDYRPGDSLRDIHWKSFARTGTPMVKEYQAECFERHALLLDTFGAGEGEAFEEAVSLAASFVGNMHGGECLLDLLFIGTQCHCFTMGPGHLQAEALMRVLALVNPSCGADMGALKSTILSRRSELSSCICILLAWDPQRRQMLLEMQQTGLPLLVLLVCEEPPADCPAWLHPLIPGKIQEGLLLL